MKSDNKTWKSFYHNNFAEFWATEATKFRNRPYHSVYQDITLASLGVQPKEKVLECGVGTGVLAQILADKGAEVFGVDLAALLIRICRENWLKQEIPLRCLVSDVEYLPYPNNYFDKTYCSSVLWYLPSPEKTIREMLRVTKPGGIVVFDVMNQWHISSITIYLWRRLQRIFGKNSGLISLATSQQISQLLKEEAVSFDVKGYYVGLPTGLPILWEKANLVQHSNLLSFGLADTPFKYLGYKLLFRCDV